MKFDNYLEQLLELKKDYKEFKTGKSYLLRAISLEIRRVKNGI